MRGWNDGATAKKKRRLRAHADEYARGFEMGENALLDAYFVAKARISATASQR